MRREVTVQQRDIIKSSYPTATPPINVTVQVGSGAAGSSGRFSLMSFLGFAVVGFIAYCIFTNTDIIEPITIAKNKTITFYEQLKAGVGINAKP